MTDWNAKETNLKLTKLSVRGQFPDWCRNVQLDQIVHVSKPHGSMHDIKKWCEENCLGQWWMCSFNPYYYYFYECEDAIKFKLVWA